MGTERKRILWAGDKHKDCQVCMRGKLRDAQSGVGNGIEENYRTGDKGRLIRLKSHHVATTIKKKSTEMETYWTTPDLNTWQKETWARWKCDGLVKENKKGSKDNQCRVCKSHPETLQHGVYCKEI